MPVINMATVDNRPGSYAMGLLRRGGGGGGGGDDGDQLRQLA